MIADTFRFAVGQRVRCKLDFFQGRIGTITMQCPRTDLTAPQCYMVDFGGDTLVFLTEEDLEAISGANGEAGPDK